MLKSRQDVDFFFYFRYLISYKTEKDQKKKIEIKYLLRPLENMSVIKKKNNNNNSPCRLPLKVGIFRFLFYLLVLLQKIIGIA